MLVAINIALFVRGADFVVAGEVAAVAEVEQVVDAEWAVHRECGGALVFTGGFAAAVVNGHIKAQWHRLLAPLDIEIGLVGGVGRCYLDVGFDRRGPFDVF